jgi:hypothetical protein
MFSELKFSSEVQGYTNDLYKKIEGSIPKIDVADHCALHLRDK